MAKKLMTHTFFIKFRFVRREFLRNHWVDRAQISEITEIIMLFQYSEFLFH